MSGLQVTAEMILPGVSMLFGAGVAWGILNQKMKNFLTYESHQKICHAHYDSIKEEIKSIRDDIKPLVVAVSTLTGYIEGLNDKQLTSKQQ